MIGNERKESSNPRGRKFKLGSFGNTSGLKQPALNEHPMDDAGEARKLSAARVSMADSVPDPENATAAILSQPNESHDEMTYVDLPSMIPWDKLSPKEMRAVEKRLQWQEKLRDHLNLRETE